MLSYTCVYYYVSYRPRKCLDLQGVVGYKLKKFKELILGG